MGLYGGNSPKTSEQSGSRLGSSPSRLPAKSQSVVEPADTGADAGSRDDQVAVVVEYKKNPRHFIAYDLIIFVSIRSSILGGKITNFIYAH